MPVKTIESFLPGATFNSSTSTFTIPVSAINAVIANPLPTGTNSAAMLYYGLLEALYEMTNNGLISNSQIALSSDNKSVQRSIYETQANTFTSCTLCSFVVSIPFQTAGSLESASGIYPI